MADSGDLSRRRLLQGGSGALAGVTLGGIWAAADTAAAGATRASLPHSSRFPLRTTTSHTYLWRKRLADKTVAQSFGFDLANGHVYVIQLATGHAPSTGNLTVSQLSGDGRLLGWMRLVNFGHGAQIGVESTRRGQAPYLWVEYAPTVDKKGRAWGQKLCRFRFTRGFTLDHRDHASWRPTDFRDRTPAISGLSNPRPSVDPVNRRLLVRFNRNKRTHAAVYDLAHAIGQPPVFPLVVARDLQRWTPKEGGKAIDGQGFTFYGQYMYLLHGEAYKAREYDRPVSKRKGNTHITCVDLNTGIREEVFRTGALRSLAHREPEGMAINLGGEQRRPELCFGFASDGRGVPETKDKTRRRFSIAYKAQLV